MSAKASIRAAEAEELDQVIAVHRRCFETDAEAGLVAALYRDGSVVESLIAEASGVIAGSVIYSRLLLDGEDCGLMALAPLAVLAGHRRQGLGERLVREAHRHLALRGERFVLVLGDPAYYRRFGFTTDAAWSLRTPYNGPYLMGLSLDDRPLPRGDVSYAPAFAGLA